MGPGMNGWLLTAAVRTVHAWTQFYTLPLDTAAQLARRAEIDSDLWEYQNDRSHDESGGHRAVNLLMRAMLGMPDDLFWSCEQWLDRARPPGLSATCKLAMVIAVAAGFVVSASGRTLDAAHVLRVDVASTGWVPVASGRIDSTLVPAFSFTLTNVGDRSMGALQVNAVFYRSGSNGHGLGAAFSSAVGGHGLAAGATSRSLLLRGQGWNVPAAGDVPRSVTLRSGVPESRARLFVKHEGRWTLLADYAIRAHLLQR
jgi:hypothetical protein